MNQVAYLNSWEIAYTTLQTSITIHRETKKKQQQQQSDREREKEGGREGGRERATEKSIMFVAVSKLM